MVGQLTVFIGEMVAFAIHRNALLHPRGVLMFTVLWGTLVSWRCADGKVAVVYVARGSSSALAFGIEVFVINGELLLDALL